MRCKIFKNYIKNLETEYQVLYNEIIVPFQVSLNNYFIYKQKLKKKCSYFSLFVDSQLIILNRINKLHGNNFGLFLHNKLSD